MANVFVNWNWAVKILSVGVVVVRIYRSVKNEIFHKISFLNSLHYTSDVLKYKV